VPCLDIPHRPKTTLLEFTVSQTTRRKKNCNNFVLRSRQSYKVTWFGKKQTNKKQQVLEKRGRF
jgi:hypothetical protein